jgi:D-3-phosphoglycerate dehydrogenase
MTKTKLLISDGFSKDGLEILEKSGLFEINFNKAVELPKLLEILPEYEAIIIRSATKLKGDALAAGKKLKAIMRAGSGVDNIDVPGATKMGITVFNTPGANNNAVVELTLGFLFSLLREIPRGTIGMKAGVWEKNALVGLEAEGRTLGVLGLGAIGASVAAKAKALGMRVVGYDPRANELNLTGKIDQICKTVDDVFAAASVVSVHMPLADSTKNSIGAQQLKRLNKGSFLINASRGGIVNESDVLAALEEGILAGAALDVFDTEPTPVGHKLVNHAKVICTPHIGAATQESQTKVALMAANSLVKYFQNGDTTNSVNTRA